MYYAYIRDNQVIHLIESDTDIQISHETDGNFVVCHNEAIINDTVTFYRYDENKKRILTDTITALRPGWTFVDGEFIPPPTQE
jgi:hypothetical protein